MRRSRDSAASLQQQATVFGIYFLNQMPHQPVIDLYVKLVCPKDMTADPTEQKLLIFAVRHPWSISFLDGGLVFTRPHAELRRRLYVLLAILESDPAYWDYFLPRQRSPLYALWIGLVGIRAVCTAMVGIVLATVVA
jgi:hypothetical protein